MKKLFVTYDSNQDEYVLNKLNKFCKEKIDSFKCQKFYDSLKDSSDGIYNCPYGFNCVKSGTKIYNCLLIKNYYDKTKIKMKKGDNQNAFDDETFFSLLEIEKNFEESVSKYEYSFDNISDFLHDVTKVNNLIGKKSDSISKSNMLKNDKAKLKSITYLSDFITKRIDLYRYISNPALITMGRKRETDAYKLWDIYRYIFIEIGYESNIHIDLKVLDMDNNEVSQVSTKFYATDSVSIIPFLLIDNAIKYSSPNSTITVNFYEDLGFLKRIVVCSNPSYAITENPNIFFNRGYRSPNNTSKSSGSGLGLSIVKQVCDHNGIEINLDLDVSADGKQEFIVDMRINNKDEE